MVDDTRDRIIRALTLAWKEHGEPVSFQTVESIIRGELNVQFHDDRVVMEQIIRTSIQNSMDINDSEVDNDTQV